MTRMTTYITGICQDRHLSMREIPNHVHARAYLYLKSNVYLSEEIGGIWSKAQPRALRKKGHSLEEYLLHLLYNYGNPPLAIFARFP